jgi:hypothetical protein
MDEALLREKGVNPLNRRISFVENFCLVIGARATLVPCANGRVHGVVFSLTHREVDELYSEARSVFTVLRRSPFDSPTAATFRRFVSTFRRRLRLQIEIHSTYRSLEILLNESACRRTMYPPSNSKPVSATRYPLTL